MDSSLKDDSNIGLAAGITDLNWFQNADDVVPPNNITDSNHESSKSEIEQHGEIKNSGDENICQFLGKTAQVVSAHLFQGFGELFLQSENHELFIIDKLSQQEQKAKEYEKELEQGKQELAEKLKVLSNTLKIGQNEGESTQ